MRTLILATGLWAAAAGAQTPADPPGSLAVPAMSAAPATPVVAPPAPTPAQTAAEKYRTEVVCRTSIETGSLVARHKTCMTRRQWSYVNDQTHDDAERFINDNRWKPQ